MERTMKLELTVALVKEESKVVTYYAKRLNSKYKFKKTSEEESEYLKSLVKENCKNTYIDVIVDGKPTILENFKKMISRCENGEVDIIEIYSAEDFCDIFEFAMEIIDELEEMGVEIYFIKEGFVSSNPDDYLDIECLRMLSDEKRANIKREKEMCEGNKSTILKMVEDVVSV